MVLLEGFNGVGLGCKEKTEEEGLPDGIFFFVLMGLRVIGSLVFSWWKGNTGEWRENEGGETR